MWYHSGLWYKKWKIFFNFVQIICIHFGWRGFDPGWILWNLMIL